ncbi:MAG: response regulator [Pseudomonadota bacterium]
MEKFCFILVAKGLFFISIDYLGELFLHKAKILTVDDDINLQTLLRSHLEQEGYRYLCAVNGKELMQNLYNEHPDIILLDLTLPQDDGLALLAQIRSKSKVALIIISGRDEAVDRIIGLEMGADDYLTKPFELRELSARIKAVLRRTVHDSPIEGDAAVSPLAKANRIAFNGWVLDRLQYQLFDDQGQTVQLTSGEFKLLEALVIAPHRVLSREHLFTLTHPGDYDAFDRAIDIQIGRIRKKMKDDSHDPVLLKTIRGVGYLFAGDAKSAD